MLYIVLQDRQLDHSIDEGEEIDSIDHFISISYQH